MNNKLTRGLSFVALISLCLTLFAFNAYATDFNGTGSISLDAADPQTKLPVDGISFRLYKIADFNNGEFSFTSPFSDNGMTASNFSDPYLSIHLMHYAMQRNISFKEKTSSAKKAVVFDGLGQGAYLIVSTAAPDGYVIPSPFIIAIPSYDEATGSSIYDITANPKLETEKEETGELTYISAKKQWEGENSHPESVKVTLLKDSIPVDTVILNAENGWYCRWDKLDPRHSWSVIEEDVPGGYNVAYSVSQMSVILTNTYFPSQEESTVAPEETTHPDDIPEGTTKPDELIDTGQLNWPVPVLSVAGLILFSIGWAILNFGKKADDRI